MTRNEIWYLGINKTLVLHDKDGFYGATEEARNAPDPQKVPIWVREWIDLAE